MNISEAHFFIYTQDNIVLQERKHDYEVMRKLAFKNSIPYQKENSTLTEERFMPFSWDKKKVVDIDPANFTEEKFLEAERRYKIKKS